MRCMPALLLLCLVPGALLAQAADPRFRDVVDALAGDDANARYAAQEQAAVYAPSALAAIAPLLGSDRPETVRAATIALERITGGATTREETRLVASEALCAALGEVEQREVLYRLLSWAGGPEAIDLLFDRMVNTPEDFEMARFALERIALGLPGTPPPDPPKGIAPLRWVARQVGLDNKPEPTPRALFAARLIEQMKQETGARRTALINTLGVLREPVASVALVDLLDTDAAPEAVDALGRTGDARAYQTLRNRYERNPGGELLTAYVRALDRQPDTIATRGYVALLKDEDPRAQAAGLLGIGRYATSTHFVDRIMPFLAADDVAVRGAARDALLALQGESFDRAIAKALRKATPQEKAGLLEVLCRRAPALGQPEAEAALRDADPDVRMAALFLLGREHDPNQAGLLREAAEKGSPANRAQALQAYIAIGRALTADGQRDAALEVLRTALTLADRAQEQILALDALAALADPRALPAVTGLQDNALTRDAASRAALAMADALRASDPEKARTIYERALGATTDRIAANAAAAGLRALGDVRNLAAEGGFVTVWQIIGPFANPGLETVYPPEQGYDPKASYPALGGAKARWAAHTTSDIFGVVDLHTLLSPSKDALAYARAEITVDTAQDILVKCGSDDGIALWVNGELIHFNDARRGLAVDEDSKPATLKAGKNVILAKISNGGDDWSFCLRLTDRGGKPLAFAQAGR